VLQGATGYVRRRLSERLGLRSSPEITFLFDPSIEYGIRLEELLSTTRPPGDEGGSPSEEGGDKGGE
jgi:ribosome-binding factor A